MTNQPHPTDVHVGRRLRERRLTMGLTQENLGNTIGVKFQQVQKYETGANRISASRLYEAARVLEKPVGWFFLGLTPVDEDPLAPQNFDEATLLRNFRRLSERMQGAVMELLRYAVDDSTDKRGDH